MNKKDGLQGESKYAKKLKTRKRLSRKLFPDSERVLTWPELWKLGIGINLNN